MWNVLVCIVSLILLGNLEGFQCKEYDPNFELKNEDEIKQRLTEVRRVLFPASEDQFARILNKSANRYIPIQADSENCRNHSNYLLDSFLNGDFWAMRMIDASTKLMAGVLDGHLNDFGNYKQCIGIEDPSQMFQGQHCTVDTTGFLPPEIADKLISPNEPYFKRDIVFSICVPSSCSVEDVALHVNRSLADINVTVYRDHLTCFTIDSNRFRTVDYIAMSIFAVVAVIIVAGTVYESRYGAKSVLSVFSMSNNYQGLMDTRTHSSEISCLNGIRVIFIIAVLMFNRMLSHLTMPTTRLRTTSEVLDSTTIAVFEVLPKAVDGFFLIGGTVLAYGFFHKRQKGTPFNVISFYINRYVRLTPVLALMMLFSISMAVHLATGPIWARMVEFFQSPCRQFWWTGLLHISNYVNPDATCVNQSWYLACDFQLHIIAPLFLIPLHKRSKVGLMILSVGIVASVVGATLNAYFRELGSGLMLSELSTTRKTELSYPMDERGFHYRISSFLIGIGLGYLMFNVKQNKANQNESKLMWQVGWVISTGILAALVAVTVVLVDPDHQYSPWLDPLFVGLSRPLFCLSLSWIILACSLGHGGLVNQFLSWSGFKPLARLTYGVYLVHYFVLAKQLFGMQVPLTFSLLDYTLLLGGDLIFSYAAAAVLYVTVEIPCCRLANYFLTDKKKRDSLEETQQMSEFRTTTKAEQ